VVYAEEEPEEAEEEPQGKPEVAWALGDRCQAVWTEDGKVRQWVAPDALRLWSPTGPP
jgi:hypothetical protein